MKVDKINSVLFQGTINNDKKNNNLSEQQQINNLGYFTRDFNVKVPQNSKKVGINRLENGLELHRYRLNNGYNVTIVPMEGSPAVVKTYVNVGSLNETPDIKGISHFLEHMAFNGTNGENGHIKLETGDTFKMIDNIGGWANASTNYAITDYVNSSPLLNNKDLETQIKVLASITEDLKLSEQMITKEKGPVSSEINMILDDPQTIAMDQTVRTLFNIKNPADELVGGSVKHIQNLTREDVVNYYNKYYTPDNINIVVTGDVNPEKTINLISKNFISHKTSRGKKFEERLMPITNTIRKDFISDKTNTAEIVIGFTGAKNNDTKDKVLFDMACTYLSTQNSGLYKNLKTYNTSPIIADDRISTNPNNPRLAYMLMSVNDNYCEDVIKTTFNTLSKKKEISDKDLELIKKKLINANNKNQEHSLNINDSIGKAVLDNDIEYVIDYNEIVNSISKEELENALSKFFNVKKAAITVVHPARNNNQVNFRGDSSRKPMKSSNITVEKLQNNYELGLYKTKSNNISTEIRLITDTPYNKKAGVLTILNEIFKMGINNKMNEDEFNEYLEENLIELHANATAGGIDITLQADSDNSPKGLDTLNELLLNPAITQENIDKAKKRIMDLLERQNDTSETLLYEFEAKNNPYKFSKEETLNSIKNITINDIKDCYNYIMDNSRGVITANIPETTDKQKEDDIKEVIQRLPSVKPNKYKQLEIYKDNPRPEIITKENSNSQADITECFKFKFDNTIKNIVCANIMNSILSSSSIGLFDTLREKEHLAYSVHSGFSSEGNEGNIELNILTTTDNKDINEISYDNLQKSIDGFNRQINELLKGKFTDKDLENAKKGMKAELLNNEGSEIKVYNLNTAISSKFGSEYQNMLYKEIDNITKEDILEFADKVFASKPIYTITATKETLENNKDYLENLKNNYQL